MGAENNMDPDSAGDKQEAEEDEVLFLWPKVLKGFMPDYV